MGSFDDNILLVYYKKGTYRHLGYERVYLPLDKVADKPFHIQGNNICMYVVVMKTTFSSMINFIIYTSTGFVP